MWYISICTFKSTMRSTWNSFLPSICFACWQSCEGVLGSLNWDGFTVWRKYTSCFPFRWTTSTYKALQNEKAECCFSKTCTKKHYINNRAIITMRCFHTTGGAIEIERWRQRTSACFWKEMTMFKKVPSGVHVQKEVIINKRGESV